MTLLGTSFIGYARGATAGTPFHGVDAASGAELAPVYHSASMEELNRAAELARTVFPLYRALPAERRVEFLRTIAEKLEDNADAIIERAKQESALPEARLRGEMARTTGQLRMFARIVEDGSWVDARIDRADPNRKPLPKVDLRSMLRPLGPVAVFCASNFPLAFSVCGGDTASAFAAGCPVVVKAHTAHPGTAELCGNAVVAAVRACDLPEGVFSLIFSNERAAGQGLIAHPAIQAGAFTGSRGGGLALLDIARKRREPIPFYAEMSAINPVFVLPGYLEARGAAAADALYASITLGVGQFCTNPGVVLVPTGATGDAYVARLAELAAQAQPCTMLNSTILRAYQHSTEERAARPGTKTVARPATTEARRVLPAIYETNVATFLADASLSEEIFGPSSVIVRYASLDEALAVARALEGNLTATIHSVDADAAATAQLAGVLEAKAGRILFAGYPTGVEVCHAMVHGGPFPSTSEPRSTSVGARAIERFVRAVCYQDAPQVLLPVELRDTNPRGILRIVDGVRTR